MYCCASRHRIVCSAPRPEAVAVPTERRVESRLQHLQDGLLDEPVQHGRNPQLPDPSPTLRYLLPSYRLRLVGPRQQPLSDLPPVPAQVLWQLLHAHPVDARTAPYSAARVSTLLRGWHARPPPPSGDARFLSARLHGPPFQLRHSPLPSGLHPYPPAGAPVAWTPGAMAFSRSTVVTLSSPFGPSSDKAGSKRIMHFVGLLWPLLTSRSAGRPNSAMPASPFQASGRDLPG